MNEKRFLHEREPLLGLFDRDSFVLKCVDETVMAFLQDVLPLVQTELTACFVALYRHPAYLNLQNFSYKDEPPIFYRWAVWRGKKPGIIKVFQRQEKACAVNSRDYVWPKQTSLGAEFLSKMHEALRDTHFQNVRTLELISKQNTAEEVPINIGSDGLWHIKDPAQRFHNFVRTVPNTTWCLYKPIIINRCLAGLVAIDGKGSTPENKYPIESVKQRIPLKACLDLFVTTLQSLYLAYYSQLEYDSPKTDMDIDYFWNSDGLVYSSVFLKKLSEILDKGKDGSFDPRYIVIYLDGNGIKVLNDKISHRVGNEVIRAMGRWLHESFWEPQDLWTKNSPPPKRSKPYCWVVRVAGDEFVVIIGKRKECDNFNMSEWKNKLRNGLDTYLNGKENPRQKLLEALKKIIGDIAPARTTDDLDIISGVSLCGGWFDNTISPKKYENIWKFAEDAMYEAKHFFKSPIMDKHRAKVGAICFPYSMIKQGFLAAEEELPNRISTGIKRDLQINLKRKRGAS